MCLCTGYWIIPIDICSTKYISLVSQDGELVSGIFYRCCVVTCNIQTREWKYQGGGGGGCKEVRRKFSSQGKLFCLGKYLYSSDQIG